MRQEEWACMSVPYFAMSMDRPKGFFMNPFLKRLLCNVWVFQLYKTLSQILFILSVYVTCILSPSRVDHPRQATLGDVFLPTTYAEQIISTLGDIYLPLTYPGQIITPNHANLPCVTSIYLCHIPLILSVQESRKKRKGKSGEQGSNSVPTVQIMDTPLLCYH